MAVNSGEVSGKVVFLKKNFGKEVRGRKRLGLHTKLIENQCLIVSSEVDNSQPKQ
jgi:hypothetical protein